MKSYKINYSMVLVVLGVMATFIGIYSLFFISPEMFSAGFFSDLYVVITIFLNPFYLLFIFSFFIYLLVVFLPDALKVAVLSLLFGFITTALAIDFFVFNQFKFHMNSFVLKVLSQPEALNILGIGFTEISAVIGLFVICTTSVFFLIRFLLKSRLMQLSLKLNRSLTRKAILIVSILVVMLADKSIYAYKIYQRDALPLFLKKDIPLYIPVIANHFFKGMGVERPPLAIKDTSVAKKKIKYPLQPYTDQTPADAKNPNIILIGADALRTDMITEEIMPNTFRFAREYGMEFKNHFSGSNGTSQGLFSLFTGLPSSYMTDFGDANMDPLFFSILEQKGYSFNIMAARNLAWLGMDEILFFKYRKFLEERFHSSSIEADKIMTDRTIELLKTNKEPFFMFSFYDSTHLPHFQNPGPFKPYKSNVLFNPSKKEDRIIGFNQYKNAAHYVDQQIKRILDTIKEKGLMENSIIIITSDHGSEKYEHGHWGHASAFTDEQLKVPFIVACSGCKKGISNRLTSHHDFVPTIMELLKDPYPHEYHTLGKSVFSKDQRSYILAAGLANRVLITPDSKIDYTPFEGISYYNVTGKSDEKVPDTQLVLNQNLPFLLAMFQDLKKFYR